MNKVSFSLLNPKAVKFSAILLRFYADDGRMKYYTGLSVPPASWNPETESTSDKGATAVLRRITDAIERLEVDCRIKGEPMTGALITGRLDALLGKKAAGSSESVFPAFEWVIDRLKDGRILTRRERKRYGKGTIRVIENTVEALRTFKPGLRFDQVTMDTYQEFIAYCHVEDFTLNYIGTLVKNWKLLMWATAGKYHENKTYEKFEKLAEEVFNIYVDETEIALLRDANLSANPRQENARNWFIIGCRTALRVSDLLRLEKKHLQGGFFTIVNEKTDTKVMIPIHPDVARIMKACKGFPPAITDVELNRVIKDIAKEIDAFQVQVVFSLTKGGQRKDFYPQKWEMISTHTMRRSGITNLLKAGVPTEIVMKLSGIKSYNTIKKYNKMTAEDAGKIAAQLDYFKIK